MASILVVDDEPEVRRTLVAFLRACGHEVRDAGNGLEAIAALRDRLADVVVTDINMPDMDGIEIVTTLRETAPTLPIIAMSGGGLLDKSLLLDSAQALGAAITLEKPFDLAALRRAVEDVMGGRR